MVMFKLRRKGLKRGRALGWDHLSSCTMKEAQDGGSDQGGSSGGFLTVVLVGFAAGQYEADEAKHGLASGQSTQKDKEPLAEMREACSWEDTNPDCLGR